MPTSRPIHESDSATNICNLSSTSLVFSRLFFVSQTLRNRPQHHVRELSLRSLIPCMQLTRLRETKNDYRLSVNVPRKETELSFISISEMSALTSCSSCKHQKTYTVLVLFRQKAQTIQSRIEREHVPPAMRIISNMLRLSSGGD